ncbi:MAG: helix-turn-helix domain-containing protein [Treponema sp.]
MDVHELEMYVCRRLKQERERQGLSQMALAYESDVSQNMITYIETGKRTPTLNTMLKLCTAMKINPSVLFPKNTDLSKDDAKRTIIELLERYM